MNVFILNGSNRRHATSTKLTTYIGKLLAEMDIEVTVFDLYGKPLPFYSPDEDAEDANVLEMREAAGRADAIILATPDYHGSLSGVLKNALDFLGKDQFDSKLVLSVSSAGGAVGTSSLTHMQAIVRNVHGVNCPEWISIGAEQRRFGPDGEPEQDKVKERVKRVLHYFVGLARQLRGIES
ncbi:MAG: NAD(P)H-dependent oxidoreductase [Paenibacillaceae bacterium]|nr:NAD(P)H-dependent oxidoreductase [Paenibacillaceae bacterium]